MEHFKINKKIKNAKRIKKYKKHKKRKKCEKDKNIMNGLLYFFGKI